MLDRIMSYCLVLCVSAIKKNAGFRMNVNARKKVDNTTLSSTERLCFDILNSQWLGDDFASGSFGYAHDVFLDLYYEMFETLWNAYLHNNVIFTYEYGVSYTDMVYNEDKQKFTSKTLSSVYASVSKYLYSNAQYDYKNFYGYNDLMELEKLGTADNEKFLIYESNLVDYTSYIEMLDNIANNEIINTCKSYLSDNECLFIEYRLQGFKNEEIAQRLDKSVHTISNYSQHVKRVYALVKDGKLEKVNNNNKKVVNK